MSQLLTDLPYGLSASTIQKIQSIFKRHPNIVKVILYGSRAKGNYRQGSDIDLTVIGSITADELMRLHVEIEDLLLPYMIDLSDYSQLQEPALLEHIAQFGQVFYSCE